jgi:hypothetical protein
MCDMGYGGLQIYLPWIREIGLALRYQTAIAPLRRLGVCASSLERQGEVHFWGTDAGGHLSWHT